MTLVSSFGRHALTYAALGLRVFPVHSIRDGRCSCGARYNSPGKHPRVREWQRAATAREGTVRGWWTKWPDANIGLATGNGVVVLDVDPDKSGDASLARLTDCRPGWRTRTDITGGGGLHFYFHADREINDTVRFRGLPGIDVRGEL